MPLSDDSRRRANYRMSWRRHQYAGMVGIEMKCELPSLVLLTENLAPNANLLVRTTDSQGNVVPSHIRRFYDFAHVILFEAEPEAGELTCELLMQVPLKFEFFVKPPELNRVEN